MEVGSGYCYLLVVVKLELFIVSLYFLSVDNGGEELGVRIRVVFYILMLFGRKESNLGLIR